VEFKQIEFLGLTGLVDAGIRSEIEPSNGMPTIGVIGQLLFGIGGI
jgi:hypothetical protein